MLPESKMTVKEFLGALREANISTANVDESVQVVLLTSKNAPWVALNGKDFEQELAEILESK